MNNIDLLELFAPAQILGFLEDHALAVTFLAAIILGAYILKKHGEAVAIKGHLAWLGFKFRTFKLPPHLIPDRNGWFPLERVICDEYYRPYTRSRKDLSLYDKAHSALRKGHEEDRRPMPSWLKGVIAILVFAEAAVFGMVLSELGMDSVTPAQQPYFAALIGLVLAIILMLAAHFAGAEWHLNELIQKAGDMSRETLRSGQTRTASALATNTKISIANDHLDDDAPVYQQLLNRLNTNYSLTPSWHWTKGTLVFIAILMVLSFIARLSVSDIISPAYAEELSGMGSPALDGLDDLFGSDPLADGASENWAATGKLSTLLIFTMIFLGIQALSIYVARAYGFATIEGRKAYEIIRKFHTREEYLNEQQALQIAIINAGQARLNVLQQQITTALSERGVDAESFTAAKNASDRTFLAFIHSKTHQETIHAYEDL